MTTRERMQVAEAIGAARLLCPTPCTPPGIGNSPIATAMAEAVLAMDRALRKEQEENERLRVEVAQLKRALSSDGNHKYEALMKKVKRIEELLTTSASGSSSGSGDAPRGST
eukprot:TRINITY_DN44789_c0_g1_i1.p2 TRINITY_DN44789_c0_g1~~TRINITY_DN44789_c0_g1_i1.p2  ORF type:complete len:112 (-),score=21.00 TRINITY_DN44789_c0_g1_i1:35-370(-)